MYKVFINDTVIYFTNDADFSKSSFNHLKMNFFHESLGLLLHQLVSAEELDYDVIFHVNDVELAFDQFKSNFKLYKMGLIILSEYPSQAKTGLVLP